MLESSLSDKLKVLDLFEIKEFEPSKFNTQSKSLYILFNKGLINFIPIFIFSSIFIPYSNGITKSANIVIS